MIYKFNIKEIKENTTLEQLRNLIVYGDPAGIVKDVFCSSPANSDSPMFEGDEINLVTYGEIDCSDYSFWNDEDGEEILWIEEA